MMNKHKWLLVAAVLFLVVGTALAQEQQAAGTQKSSESDDLLIIRTRIRYENLSRQDPFIDLEVQRKEKEKVEEAELEPIPPFDERQQKFPGVRGMLIRELTLKGIVQGPSDLVAMFQGIDGKAHFLREGDDLYNAKVRRITIESVVFEHYKRYVDKRVETTTISVTLSE
ncbi:MAG: hypothetical protein JXQ27_00725 [Acidobacteria bacterium]|nr:hypothetical protein [Acidobacteriota bacterium]